MSRCFRPGLTVAPALGALLLALLIPRQAQSLGEEKFGNEPLQVQEPAGLNPVANHPTRVYWYWVNGHEQMFYRGETAQLNEVLRAFADAPLGAHTVVLKPGPGEAKSFREQPVRYDWSLEFYAGISGHMTRLDKGDRFWPEWPVLWIHVDQARIRLAELEIPRNVQVIEVGELRRRYGEGLTSSDQTVRGWGCGQLSALDPFSLTDAIEVAGLLDDAESWVRLNAAGALRAYGVTAQPLLPTLRERVESEPDTQVQERLKETIGVIESATAGPIASETQTTLLLAIHRFCMNRDRTLSKPSTPPES